MHRPSGLLPRGSRAALLACALALALSACPGKSATPKSSGTPSPARPSGSRGGELVVAYPHEPATLNPFLPGGDSPATRDLIKPMMPTLWKIGPGGKRELSLLAEEPVTAETGGQFLVRIRLREDAVWSDGTPITTADLRFTWNAVRNRKLPIGPRLAYEKITDVRIEDAQSATLVLAKAYAGWKDLFSSGEGVLPEHLLRDTRFENALAGAWPASGGPFILKSWTRGLEMVFERTPRPWGDAAYLDRLRVQFVPDVVTAFALLEQGRVDVLGPYAAIDLERRGRLVSGASVTSDAGSTWAGLALNTRTTTLSDVRVRQALAFSLDRGGVTEGLVRAEGAKLDSFSAGSEVQESGAMGPYRPNVAEASRLLTAAGWRGSGTRSKGGSELSFTVASSPGDLADRVLRALHTQAKRAGFDLNAVTLDDDRLWRDWIRGSRFQAAMVILRDAPSGTLLERFRSGSPDNATKVADRALDGLLDAALARAVVDPVSFAAAERRLAQLVPVIPLFRLRTTLVAGKRAVNVQANGSADGFLWNVADWSKA